jgi:S-DNA-T family DNA segregation ATPase FtsK/SpoIIIE
MQDPRKEVVGMRGLFTQTIALRLRSADETRMVLGDGTAVLAPAHRLSPAAPGSAWVVEEDGTLDRVRADYWPDHLVRQAAATYPALVVDDSTPAVPDVESATAAAEPVNSADDGKVADLGPGLGSVSHMPTERRPRAPRKPRNRAPREPSTSSAAGGDS